MSRWTARPQRPQRPRGSSGKEAAPPGAASAQGQDLVVDAARAAARLGSNVNLTVFQEGSFKGATFILPPQPQQGSGSAASGAALGDASAYLGAAAGLRGAQLQAAPAGAGAASGQQAPPALAALVQALTAGRFS